MPGRWISAISPGFPATISRDDLRWALDRLRAAGIAQIVACDLTRPEFGVPVVRLVIPGLEGDPRDPGHIRRTARQACRGRAMRAVIFAGPSLPPRLRPADPAVEWRPPVRQGDLYRVALEQPAAIGVIDGYFEAVPTVWHKEILWAMSRGIHVFGAASIGALRAAELDAFGMTRGRPHLRGFPRRGARRTTTRLRCCMGRKSSATQR